MGIEYKIKFNIPQGYDPARLAKKLPNRIDPATMQEIYTCEIEGDGFYFCDHLANTSVAALAFYRLVDDALSHGQSVEIVEP